MHGYIDTLQIPLNLHLLSQLSKSSSSSSSSKGKGKAVPSPSTSTGLTAGGYDVVLNWTSSEKDSVERSISLASQLGYSTLILCLSIPPTINPSLLKFPTPLIEDLDPRTADKKGKEGKGEGRVLQVWRVNIESYDEEAVKSAGVKGVYGFSNATSPLYSSSLSLLSCSPTSLPSLSHISISLSPPSSYSPSLISLDPSLSPRLPFPLKRGLVNSLLRNGTQIELIYRGLTESGENVGKGRRNWISGAREVVRATDGRGIVVSSWAKEEGELRAPEDLINLCTLIGLTPSQAKDAITVNPSRAILRGMANRQTYRGIISNPTLLTSTSTSTSSSAAAPPNTSASTTTIGIKRTLEDTSISGGEGEGGEKEVAIEEEGKEVGGEGEGGGGGEEEKGEKGEDGGEGKRKRKRNKKVKMDVGM